MLLCTSIVEQSMNSTGLKLLAKKIELLDSIQDIESFLCLFLTPKEVSTVLTRIEIVKRLDAGDSQRKIAADLQVGIQTVSRGVKPLQENLEEFKQILKCL